MSELRWVGKATDRVDARDKVTGRAKYTSDIRLEGMAHAVLVRSPVSHGRLRGIDTSAAEAHPGVICTLTGFELAELGVVDTNFGLTVLDQPILTTDLVRFTGDPVAAVIAESHAIAEEAANLVDLEIEPLPAVLTVDDAMAGLGLVHPERDSADADAANVAARQEFLGGDVDTALAEAAHVHEATYRFPLMSQYAMEPHACIATWEAGGAGDLEVISGCQQPFKVRSDLARMFGLRLNRVRVRVGYVGGAYGGKLLSKYEPVTAAAAKKARRPVRLVLSVEEGFRTIARHAAVIQMRTGIDEEGNLVARDSHVILDTGAYADKGPGVVRKAAFRVKGPYDIPHFRSVALAVYTNKIPAGAFRGYSTPQVAWAGESAINEIADHLGENPLEFRRKRLLRRGGEFMPGDTPLDADLTEGIGCAAKAVGWGEPLAPGRGRGLATGVKDGGGGPSRAEAEVRILADGSIEVLTGTCEIGQGALTVFSQIAAEEVGCELDVVTAPMPDTGTSPFDHGTEASRSTVLVGSAVRSAAIDAAQQLRDIVERHLGSPEFQLQGPVVRTSEGREAPLSEILCADRNLPKTAEFELGPIIGQGHHFTFVGKDSPLGTPTNFYEVGHGAAEVAVDTETGQVRLVRYASVADIGQAINPRNCIAQDEGSTIMGIGHTMFEELAFEDGEPVNTNLAEYRVPMFEDLPAEGLHALLLENRDGPGPYGAKGAGEGGTISVGPAVAAAVYEACGVRLRTLPLTPERVYQALQEHRVQQERCT